MNRRCRRERKTRQSEGANPFEKRVNSIQGNQSSSSDSSKPQHDHPYSSHAGSRSGLKVDQVRDSSGCRLGENSTSLSLPAREGRTVKNSGYAASERLAGCVSFQAALFLNSASLTEAVISRFRFFLPAPLFGPETTTSSVSLFFFFASPSARCFSRFLSRLRRVDMETLSKVPYSE